MRLPKKAEVLFLMMTWCGMLPMQAQSFPAQMKQTISNENVLRSTGIKKVEAVRRFYALHNYEPAFLKEGDEEFLQQLLGILSEASSLGLQERDYQFDFISLLKSGKVPFKNGSDSVGADIRLAEAALHFLSDVYSGNNPPAFSYDGLRYQPHHHHI